MGILSENQIFSCKGELLNRSQPSGKGGGQSYNMGIWWSGSLNRQVLDGVLINGRAGELETRLFTGSNFGVKSINSSKANPCFMVTFGETGGKKSFMQAVTTPNYAFLPQTLKQSTVFVR